METKNEIIKKRIPVGRRSPYFCVWLQEMAEQGLILKSIGFLRCEFEKGEPEKIRYRILDKSHFSMSEEEKGIYEDAGWKYIPNEEAGRVTVFAADDEDAPELFSDNESYRKYRRNKWIGSAAFILVWVYWLVRAMWLAIDLFHGGEYVETYGRLHNLDGEPLFFLVIIGLFTVILTGIYVYHIINEILAVRHYAKGDMPQYDIPYNDRGYLWEKKATRIYDTVVIILLAGLGAALISLNMSAFSLADGANVLEYNGEHPVMLREIDPAAWADAEPMIEKQNTGEYAEDLDIDYIVGKDTGACFSKGWREQLWVEKNTLDETQETDYLSASRLYYYFSAYYDARSESIAEEYLGEEAAYDLYGKVDEGAWSKALEAVRIECDGADYAGYYTTEYAGAEKYKECQHLLIRKGKVIEIVGYQGPVDLRDKINVFVDEISQ